MLARLGDLHENERVVRLAQEPIGQLLILGLGVLLLLHDTPSVLAAPVIVFASQWPERRRLVLSVAGVLTLVHAAWVGLRPVPELGSFEVLPWEAPGASFESLGAVALVLLVIAVTWAVAVHLPRLPGWLRRHPQLAWHAVILSFLGLACLHPGNALIQTLVYTVTFLTWRVAYLLKHAQAGLAGTRLVDHFFYLWPAWGGSRVPYGQGLQALGRREAGNDEELVRSQLAGLKLLLLAKLWLVVVSALKLFVLAPSTPDARVSDHNLGLPRLSSLIEGSHGASLGVAWLAVLIELVHVTLRLAVYGHVVIGCLRLCGFNVFRNTYKPLLAESLVEFWGRYAYYFKELMLELFFYPTFLRLKVGPRLRMFCAVFAAAFVGNLYFHLLLERGSMVSGDWAEVWRVLESRLVYCFFLALGIWLSMLRQQSRRGEPVDPRWHRRLLRIAGVWLFFGLLRIWNVKGDDLDLADRARFFVSLFGWPT
ncbi:MAG: hypothetical protein AAF533_07510 [Acidobacteriota bacterium]